MKKICLILLVFLSNLVYAQTHVDSLLFSLKSAQHDTVRISKLISLSKELGISKDSSFKFVTECVKISEATKSNEWISKAYVALGLWYLNIDKKNPKAIEIWHELYERMRKENYLRGMGLAYRYIGKAYLFNTADSAIHYNLKSIEIFESLKDSDMVNSIKINLAVVYAHSGRELEGIALSKEGMIYAEKVNNIMDAGVAAVNVGYFYEWIGEYDSATVYFKKSMAYNAMRGDPVGIGHSKAKQADILLKKNKLNEAISLYNDVRQIGDSLNSDRLLNYSYEGFASVAMIREQWDEAIKNYKLAYQYSGKNKTEELKYYENLHKAHLGKADFKNALEYYKLFITSRDTFNNAERLQKVDELEAKYQNREKQNKIELLNKENEIQQADARRQQIIRNSIILFSIVVIAMGGLLFNRFKLKKQIESQQALLTERKRISAELHDDLGAQLSTARMFLTKLKSGSSNGDQSNIIDHSLKILDGSINDLRRIMNDLQTSTLQEKGLIIAIEELVNRINELQEIRFSLSHHNMTQRLSAKSEHNLFRISQELINNTMKYAGAKKVSIDFTARGNELVLVYEDDGKGMDVNKDKRGNGLTNIESRAVSLGGSAFFDSFPGKGFSATIEIPLLYESAKS